MHMRRKIRRLFAVSKKASRFAYAKLKNRDFNNFYGGKSVSHLAKKAVLVTFTEGPLGLLRRSKNFLKYAGFSLNPTAAINFPNGLKGYFARKEINDWFAEHGKKALIVIPSYNDFEILSDCVKSLHDYTPLKQLEVVIVDDYCQPDNLKKLRTLENEYVTIVPRKKNGGFAKAVNTGLRVAQKKKMDAILMNSDIVAKHGWYESLQFGAYKYHKDVGLVGPKLLYPDGRIQSAGSFRNPHSPEWFDHYYRFKPEDFGPANIPQYCIGVTGACTYIKYSVIKKIGILDEKYPFAFEDMDYALRAWKAGFRSLYFPDSVLYHMESATRKKNPTMNDRQKGSVRQFWKTWGDWFDKRNVKNANGQIRIIFVLQTVGLSGGIKITFEHANRLHKLGFATEVWSLDKKPAWNPEVPHRAFDNYDKLIKALAEEEAIKVATWWETAQPVWLASMQKGIPVYFIQEIESWFYPNDLRAQHAVLACYRFEFRNLTTSVYNEQELRQLHLLNDRIPCGIDTRTYHPLNIEREKDVLLAVGRTFFQKNFKFTLAAWKKLGAKRPQMWLFGQEKDMQKLDSKITYFYKPSDEKLNELYNQATVFVQTSYHEGFSLPPLEAMASGCPVITTDSHGNRDYIEDGKNCIVVEQDNILALEQAIARVVGDLKLQQKLSKNALKTAKQYDWDNVTRQLAEFYATVAEDSQAAYIKKTMKNYE